MSFTVKRWILPAIWLAVSVFAALTCSVQYSSARLHDEYIPVGNDSFYHARRILDAVQASAEFYQFDPKIHAPEGSLLVWPWGYDYLMAGIVRAGITVGLDADPMAILVWIPVAALFLSIGLTVTIGRQLSLSASLIGLAALCMACSPSTRLLHGIGEIDHHFAELIFVLGSLAAGLAWFLRPSVSRAVLLGVTLGVAPAIHNGLFILQIPLLATLVLRWLQGETSPPRPALTLAITLLTATLAVLVPSLAFQTGRFEFYTLSWFHAYIAAATAVLIIFLTRVTPTRASMFGLSVLAAALLLGILSQLDVATGFLGGTFERLKSIQEMRSPLALAPVNPVFLTKFYSFLIWLAPLTLILCIVECWRQRRSPLLLFWVTSVWGLALLSTQLRMHYFGAFALYLPWLVLGQRVAHQHPERERYVILGSALALLLAYAPQLRYELLNAPPKAADVWYERVEPLLPILRDACAQDPGIVLADNDAGHYVRYATDCSVIANNFLLTPQHFAKADLVDYLYSLTPTDLLAAEPLPKYVLVRPARIARADDGKYSYRYFGNGPHRLAPELLFRRPESLPAQYRLLGAIPLPMVAGVAYAKLYKIERDDATQISSSR
jgi:asparagine N-glycosylation enzyme membrane subunit Stt3